MTSQKSWLTRWIFLSCDVPVPWHKVGILWPEEQSQIRIWERAFFSVTRGVFVPVQLLKLSSGILVQGRLRNSTPGPGDRPVSGDLLVLVIYGQNQVMNFDPFRPPLWLLRTRPERRARTPTSNKYYGPPKLSDCWFIHNIHLTSHPIILADRLYDPRPNDGGYLRVYDER